MNELQKIKMKIRELQNKMYKLIDQKENLLAPEVIHTSKTLDKVLNQYHKVKNK